MRQKKSLMWWGYLAGMISGITYGMNPLFGVPVLNKGLSVSSLLFYRYGMAIVLMAIFMLIKGEKFKITWKQLGLMGILGTLFILCSITLFISYNYIPSGIATTIIYIYPILVALIMVFLKQYPTWQTWVSIIVGVIGAVFLSLSGEGGLINHFGILLVVASALFYTLFIVIVNQSKTVKQLPNITLTFYCFLFSTLVLFIFLRGGRDLEALPDSSCWLNIIGLAILPTAVATITLAAATKIVGATKTSVLGILEPLTAIFVGTVLFHEPFTVNIAIGIVLILFAILFMIFSKKK